MPDRDGKQFDWSDTDAVNIFRDRPQNIAASEGDPFTTRFCGVMARDGSFRVEDVPPGDYSLTISIIKPGSQGFFALTGEEIGTVKAKFTVPKFESDATLDSVPLDLGTLKPDLKPIPAAAK